jgi:ABC-type antimicrobial peptide transport system permease subunit
MKLTDTIRTALQNLGRRKVRTVLTSIGVFVGILTIVTMVSLGIGVQKQVTDTIKELGLETVFVAPDVQGQPAGAYNPFARPKPEKPLTPDAIATLQKIPGVQSVGVTLELPAAPEMTLTVDGKTFPIVLVERDPERRVFGRPQSMLAGEAVPETPDSTGIVLSQRLLKGAGYSTDQYASLVGRPATISVTAPRGDKADFKSTVIGVSDAAFGAELGNSDKLELKKWWYNDPNILQTDGYMSAVVHTDSLNDATRVANEVTNMGFQSATLQTFLDQANRIFTILQVMLSSVGLLALLVASIGIVNTMIMAIYERTREIGVLKALGSSNGDVLRMFMVEAGMIGLLGGVVGVISGWLLGLVLNALIPEYFKAQGVPLPIGSTFFLVNWQLVAGALVFATLVGIAAGLYPAFRAARLDPLAALRHE